MRRIPRAIVAALATCFVLAGGLLFSATPVLAGTGHAYSASFGEPCKTGEYPCGPGKFNGPSGVAVNEVTPGDVGDVYAVNKGNNRVEYFSSSGTYLGQFNGGPTPAKSFSEPEAIAIDNDASSPSKGDVYVTDIGHDVIDKFSPSGTYLGQITGTCPAENETPFDGTCEPSKAPVVLFGRRLEGVSVDPAGLLWVSQCLSGYAGTRIGDSNDVYVEEYSNALVNEFLASRSGYVYSVEPGLAVNSEDNLYVVHNENYQGIAKLSSPGEVLTERFGGAVDVRGVAVDPTNNDVYIDSPSTLGEYAADGSVIQESFGSEHLTAGSGIGVDSASNTIYVADSGQNDVHIYTSGPTPQQPKTNVPSEIMAKTATLNGALNPENIPTDYYFSYNKGESCTGKGAITTPLDPPNGPGHPATGSSQVNESAKVSNLQPSASYSVCFVAETKYGATSGPAVLLQTLGEAPEIVAGSEHATSAEGAEVATEVQFTAEINPNNLESTYTFEYSLEGSTTGNTLEGAIKKAGGVIPTEEFGAKELKVDAELGDYTDTYYYRTIAESECEPVAHPGQECRSIGDVQAFTKVPIVENEAASKLTLTSATLEATVNPFWQPTKYRFEYSTSKAEVENGQGTPVDGASELGEALQPDPVSVNIGGLIPDERYYYRVVAENKSTKNLDNADKGVPVRGKVEEFVTHSIPYPSTGEASNITGTSATLSGTVLPPVLPARYYFQYISETAYQAALGKWLADPYEDGEATTPLPIAASESPQAVGPIPVSGLLPGETYHYRLVASNAFGSRFGEEGEADHTFKTLPSTPPIVSTGGVSGVSQTSATIAGTVASNGLATEYGFEISTEPGNYGPATGLGSVGGAQTESIQLTLRELQPGTTYYYRVTASNGDGIKQGAEQSFTTAGLPDLFTVPPVVPLYTGYQVPLPKESGPGSTTTTTKTLTNAQKLGKALNACKRDKSKAKRESCEKREKKRYPVAKAKKGKRK